MPHDYLYLTRRTADLPVTKSPSCASTTTAPSVPKSGTPYAPTTSACCSRNLPMPKTSTGANSSSTAAACCSMKSATSPKVALHSTALSIQEIANRFHFPDQSYLGRYFKHHTGMSPTAYREKKEELSLTPSAQSPAASSPDWLLPL